MVMEMTAWPEQKVVRPLICAYFCVILSGLTALCTLRLASIGSFRAFWRISLARKLILLTLLDSWAFAYASAVILFGVGSGLNQASCLVGILNCILTYASSKIMIYMFLCERLYICHSPVKAQDATFKDRLKSWWYRIAVLLLLAWVCVAIVMLIGRNAHLSSDGTCKIGLKIWATTPLLSLDALVNFFLTAGFVTPLLKAGFRGASKLIKQSCLAAGLALVTSFVNICILAVMKGHQQAYVCLSSCVFDVAANAWILFIITRHPGKGEGSSRANAERGIEEGNYGTASMAQVGTSRPTLSSVNKRHSSTLVASKPYIPTFPAFNESVVSLRISPSPSTQLHTDARRRTSTFVSESTEQLPISKPAKAFMFEGIQISRTTHSAIDGPEGMEKGSYTQPASESAPFFVSLERESSTPQSDGSTLEEKENIFFVARKDSL